MGARRTVHRCQDCGSAAPRWSGRCAGCGAWNTLVEEAAEPRRRAAVADGARPVAIVDVDARRAGPQPTAIDELDRVLGGGLVPGSVTVLGGEPGVGKSTLLLQVLAARAAAGETSLLVSAEESAHQVRLRAERLGCLHPGLLVLAETALPAIEQAIAEALPSLVVVDSVQTIGDPDLGSAPGSVVQVRECANQLVELARRYGTAVVLVGHVTKDGMLAGPRVLEHVVDTVLSFEGERHHALRLLRAVKHRHGPTGELGLFAMGEAGLVGVPDAGGLFLGDRRCGVPGSVVVPAIEGRRPLLVELQALVSRTSLANPRRSAQGLDAGRLALLLAVLRQRAGVDVAGSDVYASAVGGARVTEPAADLAVALAVASAARGVATRPGVVVCGEVGLAGEVRRVGQLPRRLSEAARLGFVEAIVPAAAADVSARLRLHAVATLSEALDAAGLACPRGATAPAATIRT